MYKLSGPHHKGRRSGSSDSIIEELQYTRNICFGEAKAPDEDGNVYELVRDSVFSKESIDVNRIQHVFGFQSIGFRTSFYVSSLTHAGLYVYYELFSINFPKCQSYLPHLITQFDGILKIKKAFGYERLTNNLQVGKLEEWKREDYCSRLK